MNPTTIERDLSRVACLQDELDGIPIDPRYWAGYHPRVYNESPCDADKLVADLCARLQKRDVTQFSLEMQIWWRDHQHADQERIEKERRAVVEDMARDVALQKLTPAERELLGLDRLRSKQ
jgi:hypothetical protein